MRKYSRKIKKGGRSFPRVIAASGVVIVGTFVIATAIKGSKGFWSDFTRQAAVASILYSMPEQSLDLLEKRFNSELFEEEEMSTEQTSPSIIENETNTMLSNKPQIGESQQKPEVPTVTTDTKPKTPQPEIPEEYRGDVVEENMGGRLGNAYLSCGNGLVKNSTNLPDDEVEKLIATSNKVEIGAEGPQVLIMHTHATESFEEYDSDIYDTRNTWRTTDNEENIVSVGEKVAEGIRSYGIEVIHDDTQHDYPSYNGSYERSEETIQKYLDKYPTISVVLDVHRDAVQRNTTLVKPISEINGKKAAQLMIISGCDDGTMNMPNWRTNFRFAVGLQDAMESEYPGLTRPIFFCYRRYNQQMTTGSLLIEFGSHGNTLEEVLYSGELAGDAIGKYLSSIRTEN